ncbi:MAG: polyphosphate polymerase domain-containing protein [Clostridiales bacterium]|nr:polyphosphate polymerase domain-containing protein [Clostridiales bacterium]
MSKTIYQGVFKRYEKKYLLNQNQYQNFYKKVLEHMEVDCYGKTTICSLYYDTPDFRLIRNSIDKPVYKEKIRIRCYGIPSKDSLAFVELKRKFKGEVYKRRVNVPYNKAYQWLTNREEPKGMGQIGSEINWFLDFYKNLIPSCIILYDRIALVGKDDKSLRITFDENIRYRDTNLDISNGDEGNILLDRNMHLIEIKIQGAMPLWLTKTLSENRIYPTSFSKYGNAYIKLFNNKIKKDVTKGA